MKPLRLAALAMDDLQEAIAWYEDRASGGGRRFIDAVDGVLSSVRERPLRYPVVHKDVRRALVRSLSFAVFFRDLPDVVRVVAIVHQHRDPRVARRRR